MKKDLSIIVVLAFILVAGAVLFRGSPDESLVAGIKIGEAQTFDGLVIKPLSVEEDSRCAEGVQCIWAGTVKVKTEIKSGLGVASQTVELNKPITTEAEEITLTHVYPNTKTGTTIKPSDYNFTYSVKKRSLNTNPPVSGNCYIGGCSSQICSSEPDVVSTCEWTEAYACYRTAKCERQASGQCGWTGTPELQMCLNNASQNAPTETIY